MAIFKFKNKAAPADFSYSSFPRSRKAQFWDILKLRWKTLLVISGVIFLAFLPLLIVLFFRDNNVLLLSRDVADGTIASEIAKNKSLNIHFYYSLFSLPCLLFAGVVLSGLIRIFRQIIWGEPLFFLHDYFRSIKESGATAFMVSFLFALTAIGTKSIYFMSENEILRALLPTLFFVFLVPALMTWVYESAVYQIPWWSQLKNAFLLYFGNFPLQFFFAVLLFAPVLTVLISSNLVVKYLVLALLTVLYLPLMVLVYSLFQIHLFDESINKKHFSEIYHKGLYDPSKGID